MNVVSYEKVSDECGLKRMWFQMNVVSNEKVSCECPKLSGISYGLHMLFKQNPFYTVVHTTV